MEPHALAAASADDKDGERNAGPGCLGSINSLVRLLPSACLVLAAAASFALPIGGRTTAGNASVTAESPTALAITQSSQRAVIDWRSFGVAAGESVVFKQPGAGAVTLNRVMDGQPSVIFGRISANGQVFLVNPGGVLFGPTARVDVGGLVAATLAISNRDFLAGRTQFSAADAAGSIRNSGRLGAEAYIALIAPEVANSGTIAAKNVALVAGKKVSLDFAGDDLLKIRVDGAALNASIVNSGAILADGGTVVLTARAAGELVGTVINQTGIVQARSLSVRNGQIVLDGGSVGSVDVAGTLDASGNSAGGSIAVFGADIDLRSTRLDASGEGAGGTVLVGGDSRGTPAAVADKPVSNARNVSIDAASIIMADARNRGNGGKVVVWAEKNTRFDGRISARGGPAGGNGGMVETSGAQLKVGNNARVDTDAARGSAGIWLLDPGDFTIAASGGDMSGSALSGNLGTGDVQIQSSSGGGGTNGDINVDDGVSWSSHVLMLTAQNNININTAMNASGTASLALEYGQGAVAAGNASTYNVSAAVNLPTGNHFSTKLGSDGSTLSYTVINSLGAAGSATGSDLQGMNGNRAGKYALGSDIDASTTSGWNSGAGFLPVGDGAIAFTGQFDGLGHTVSGLTINRPTQDFAALFGYIVTPATVSNIGMVGGKVSGQNNVGGLVGNSNNGTVNNSYATGSATGNRAVGGLVGYAGISSRITNSYATGAVSGHTQLGGLVGGGNSESITNSYASGDVSASADDGLWIGGLVGVDVSGTITNSYATGNVNGGTSSSSEKTGGLIGYSLGSGRYTDVYATGSVTGYTAVGGLVGQNNGSITRGYASGPVTYDTTFGNGGGFVGFNYGFINNSFWDKNTGYPTDGNGSTAVGLTTAQALAQASYSGFDFTNTWYLSEGNTRPFLRTEYSTAIGNAHQLQLMAVDPSKDYTLLRDIDMSELGRASGMWNVATGFVPVGTGSPWAPFSGSLDGLGHTIGGLTINLPATDQVGLFGVIAGKISNVGLRGGAIAGHDYVGGLTGYCSACTIRNAYSTVAVTGNDNIGGLVGANYGSIYDAYATGAASGRSQIGGLVGLNEQSINRSYSTGLVTGTGTSIGGLIGNNTYAYFDSTNGLYWDKGSSGQDTSAGGAYVVGMGSVGTTPTAAMMDHASFGGFGFDPSGNATTWRIYDGHTLPILKVFLTPLSVTASADSKTYDGFSYSGGNGVVYSDPAAVPSGALGYGGSAQGAKNAGSYAITPNGLWSPQYDITFNDGTLSINKAALTLNAVTDSKVYDGGTGSAGVVGTTGLVGGDTVSSLSQSFTSKNVPGVNGSTLAVNAGYTVSDGNDGNNYIVTENTATGSITAKSVTLTAPVVSKTYDGRLGYTTGGADLAELSAGLVGGDKVSAATIAYTDKNAGNGNKTVTLDSTTLSDGNGGANYSVTLAGNAGSTIGKAALTASVTAADKVYDGTTAAALTSRTLGGVIAGDAVSLTGGSASFDTKDVGNAKTVTATGLHLAGLDAGNYTADTTATTRADITPARLDLSLTAGITVANKVYEGTTAATITGRTLAGVIGGDDVSLIGGTATFDNKNVGTAKTVTAIDLALSGTAAGNYTANTTATTTANIGPKPLTLAATAASKTYDGSDLATVTGYGLSGFIGTETVIGASTGASFSDRNAADGKTVAITGISLSNGANGGLASNYSVAGSTTTTADIGKAALTASVTAADKVYDGTTAARITSRAVSGVIGGDAVSLIGGNASFDTKGVGDAKKVTATGLALGGLDAGNYTANPAATTTAGITPARLIYLADAASRAYGQANPAFTGSVGGFRHGETLADATTGGLAFSSAATPASPAGNYEITGGGLSAANYSFSQAPGNSAALRVFAAAEPPVLLPAVPLVAPPLPMPEAEATVSASAGQSEPNRPRDDFVPCKSALSQSALGGYSVALSCGGTPSR